MKNNRIVYWWAIIGTLALLTQAVIKLTPIAIDALSGDLSGLQWGLAIGWIVINAHAEGVKGFHQAFSPRVVKRAEYAAQHPSTLRGVLAPLFAMGFFHATKKRLIVSYVLWGAIIILIVAVRQLAQPWRGIVDAGVVVGLGIGMASVLYYVSRSVRGISPSVSPDVPTPCPSSTNT